MLTPLSPPDVSAHGAEIIFPPSTALWDPSQLGDATVNNADSHGCERLRDHLSKASQD